MVPPIVEKSPEMTMAKFFESMKSDAEKSEYEEDFNKQLREKLTQRRFTGNELRQLSTLVEESWEIAKHQEVAKNVLREEMTRESVSAATVAAPVGAPKEDSWLPKDLEISKWSNKQIATVSAVTLGAVGLFALWRSWRNREGWKDDSKSKPEEKRGWGRALFWIPVVGLGIAAGYVGHQYLKQFQGYVNALKGMQKTIDDLRKRGRDALPFGHGPWEKYGISKEDYKEAEKIYRTRDTAGRPKIAGIFKPVADGKENPHLKKFMDDMGEKYKMEKKNGVNYVMASVALANYEEDVETVLHELIEWLRMHTFEVGLASIFAARIGILQSIVSSTLSAPQKLAHAGKELAKWGITHPITALCLLSGSLFTAGGSLFALHRAKDSLRLPENLRQLSIVCLGDEELVSVGIEKALVVELRAGMREVGAINEEYGPWVTKQVQELMRVLTQTAPEMLALTPEESIAQNNSACMYSLRHYVEMRLRRVHTSKEQRNQGIGAQCENALELLNEFEGAFLRYRCTDSVQPDAANEVFMRLTTALTVLGLTVMEKDGVITWKSADMPESFDLCVSPSVKNRAELKLKSERLRSGENFTNYLLWNGINQFREIQQKAMNVGENLTENKAVAMVVGNFLYIFEDPVRNTKKYLMVPLDLALDAIGMQNPIGGMNVSRNWTEWGANVTTGTLTCAMFSLNVALLAKVKRFVIGGGSLHEGWKSKFLWNVTPGLSQANIVLEMRASANDVRVLKRFGFLRGRQINNALATAYIRPEWIGVIEFGTREQVLRVANLADLSVGDTDSLHDIREQCRKAIKHEMRVDELRLSKIRENLMRSGLRFWEWPAAFRSKELAYQEKLYKDLCYAFGEPKMMLQTGVEVKVLLENGVAVERLVQAGAKTEELIKAGVSLDDLLRAGVAEAELVRAGAKSADVSAAAARVAPSAAPRSAPRPSSGTGLPKGPPGAPSVGPAEGSTQAWRSSAKAEKVLQTAPRLAKALDESPEFARLLMLHIEKVHDATKFLHALESAASAVKDTSFLSRVLSTEAGFARVIADVEKGADVTKILTNATRVSRIGQSLKLTGRALPVVADSLVIYATVNEMLETREHLEKLRREGKVSEDIIRLEEQREAYQWAQIGVSGIGLGAGVCLVAGVGGAIAGPVALVTLPISAVIYGAYEGHKWTEAQARTVEDWKNEYDVISLLTDVRTYSIGERVGHWWEVVNPNGYDMFVPLIGTTTAGMNIYRHLADQKQGDRQSLIQRIRNVDESKVRAIVEHTTSVTVPATVRGTDGGERPLTPSEVNGYRDALKQYVDAKVAFFLSFREDDAHPIRSNGDIADLLEGAEYAGLLAKDRPQLKAELVKLREQTDVSSQERAGAIQKILEEENTVGQAKLYGIFVQQEQLGTQYAVTLMRLAIAEKEQRSGQRAGLEQCISRSLVAGTQHAYINFCVQCEEANLKDWWPDNDAQRIARLYASERMEEIASERSPAIVEQLFKDVETPVESGVYRYQRDMKDAQNEIEKFLGNPKSVWEGMPAAMKGRLGYAFVDGNQEKMPELLQKRVRAGEALMNRINANYNGSYYTKQYGWWGNQYLHMTFDRGQGKWMASLWNLDDPKDPASFRCDMWGGSDDYNKLLESLQAINEGKQPSV